MALVDLYCYVRGPGGCSIVFIHGGSGWSLVLKQRSWECVVVNAC